MQKLNNFYYVQFYLNTYDTPLIEPNGFRFKIESVYSKKVKDTTQEVKTQIINPMFINVAIMVYIGLEDFEDPNESLENNHVLNPRTTPSTKHNIA